MVAYSFKRRFVVPIARGLGVEYPVDFIETMNDRPKRQTIRANGKRRHARPGDELQLYHAMRTKQCFMVGKARCTSIKRITIRLEAGGIATIMVDGALLGPRQMRTFARADGFADLEDMEKFWTAEHGSPQTWAGVLIQWEPIAEAA